MTYSEFFKRDVEPLSERIDAAIKRVTSGHGCMRIPAEATDPDLVLSDCKAALATRDARIATLEAALRTAVKACDEVVDTARWTIDPDASTDRPLPYVAGVRDELMTAMQNASKAARAALEAKS